MTVGAQDRLVLEAEFWHALERRAFLLHYQPIVSLATRDVVAVEALLRWPHPTRGLIAPSTFVPLAEENGLIHPLGRWVLDSACRQAQTWRRVVGSRAPVVSVNLSTRQLLDGEFVDEVGEALSHNGVAPHQLQLEITETAVMANPATGIATLHRLRELGVRLALDDFGTGYSSLACLKHFPVDVLKIDRTFVRELGRDPRDDAIIQAVIELSHGLSIEVTAEGIERAAQARQLLAMGCERGQGYYFARPGPAAELGGLLRDMSQFHVDIPVMDAVDTLG